MAIWAAFVRPVGSMPDFLIKKLVLQVQNLCVYAHKIRTPNREKALRGIGWGGLILATHAGKI
jgi:hypothetical protein